MRRKISKEECDDILRHLKRVNIEVSNQLHPKGKISDINNITYSSITNHSQYDQLGDFVVIDTETTGLSAIKGEIVEICAIRFRNYKPVECFETLCKPSIPISPSAYAVNGISEDMVIDKPHFRTIVKSLNDFIGNDSIVGQNLPFDLKFIVHQGFELLSIDRKYYDTLLLAKSTLKARKKKYNKDLHEWICFDGFEYDVDNYKLGTLCHYYDIPLIHAHRALADCYATGLLFEALVYQRICE